MSETTMTVSSTARVPTPALASHVYILPCCTQAIRSSPRRSSDHSRGSITVEETLRGVPQVPLPQVPAPQPKPACASQRPIGSR